MKKMKVLFALILALLLAPVFAACPSGTPDIEPEEPPVVSGREEQPRNEPEDPITAEVVTDVDIPAFGITVNGVAVTQETLFGRPRYKVTAKTVNSFGTESETEYVGFALKDVLDAANLKEKYTSLTAAASDGYTVTLTGEAIYKNYTLLAVTKGGKAFAALPWFAPCGETATGSYIKNTASLLLE